MDNHASIAKGASILVASLPLLFFLLRSAARSRFATWIVPPSKPQAPAASHADGGRIQDSDASEQTHDQSTNHAESERQPQSAPSQASNRETQSFERPRIAMPPEDEGSDTRSESPPTPRASSSAGLMPPPPRPQQTTSKPPVPAPPTLSATPSRTSNLAQRNNPQARRGPSSSLAPPSTNGSLQPSLKPTSSTLPAPQRPRQKVILEPGHSPLDWAHLTSTTPANKLAGVPHLQRVTPSMLAQCNGRKGKPAWSAFRGKVYNISPYMDFHPGGVGELRRGAGKIGDKLFDEIHSWVNVDGMLGSCLVGVLVSESEGNPQGGGQDLESMD